MDGSWGAWGPVAATAVTIALAVLVSHKLVAWVDRRSRQLGGGAVTRPKPAAFQLVWRDLPWFVLGFLGQFIAAVLQDGASTWSYFIDLGAFAVATVLVVVYRPNSFARIVGLLVLGIHIAQIIVSSDTSPFNNVALWVREWIGYVPGGT